MLTKALSSNEAHRDIWLDAFITACRGLIATAKIRGDWKRVADLALEVVERISFKLQRQTVTANYLQTLLGWRFDLAREHFDATARYISSYGDQINLFDATIRLAEYDVLLSDLIRRGVGALSIWWSGVEARPVIDETARGILSKQLRRLNSLEKQLSKLGKPQTETLGAIQEVSHDLAFRGAKYGRAA
ncbi:hypothetical protein C8J34_1011220 [Rhizobium sp. PP-F2F-G36]|nr:hypothetical protein C8J34_1011220 [Rhizobium sp. PP-F2F-G36]